MEDFQSAYQEEKQRLDDMLEMVEGQLTRLKGIPVYTGHDFTEQMLEEHREESRQQLMRSVREPYFGRLDFSEVGKSRSKLYIGKQGVYDPESSKPIVIDWRAPVASLFYSFTGGDDASYEAPEGVIEGLVYLKRNLVIRQGILERVSDTYNRESEGPAVSDEFLVYRLGENKDNRLRDIVSTIQAEQDLIIRAAKNTALIIQGVAGSGKTTVALHRLAFLLYQYKEQIKAERMVIFAPNHMFIDYISEVLPELGVGDIQQSTFADWATSLLALENEPQDDAHELTRWFDLNEGQQQTATDSDKETIQYSGRFKGSLNFREMLDSYLERLEPTCVPEQNFEPWEGVSLSFSVIADWFNGEYRHYPVAKRKERVLARIHRWIEMELKKAPSAVLLKERKKKAQQREKAYARKWPELDSLAIYKRMMQDKSSGIPSSILKETHSYLKEGQVKEEDLAALLYLFARTQEIGGNMTFDHVVIDEAQDFSPLQVAVLDEFVKGHSFTILGDLSQAIHYYKGIQSWKEMQDLFTPEDTAYYALTRSYRSTMEIIDFANGILERGVGTDLLAVPVFRSGEPVKQLSMAEEDREEVIAETLTKVLEGSHRTVALLTRTMEDARKLHGALSARSFNMQLIGGEQRQYMGGISVLPTYLSKGLEFDAVILTDVDEAQYRARDARLLYVGCTRALHELWLLHSHKLPSYVTPVAK